MSPRTRCVWGTGIAVPAGALLGAGMGMAIGQRSGEGMADLAGLATGLVFGGPLLALLVFVVTVPATRVARPLLAVAVMVGGVVVTTALALATVAVGSRLEIGSATFVILFVVAASVAAGFARLALTLADRRV